MKDYNDYRLCFVEHRRMWFAKRDPSQVWGDDWNDAPYEHNAGDPYPWVGNRENVIDYQFLMYAGNVYGTPAEHSWSGNSALSVQMINNGDIAWLRQWENKGAAPIMAGVGIMDCIRIMRDAGEHVFIPLELAHRLAEYEDFEVALLDFGVEAQ